ncbi:hypothetical protein SAMD00019534_122000, partial [Acytostelium subglobosum LB1]|uniref:hypothetical protein n=1 Tax=Acytostelium subglobosum LB1 TaxID=1410327 RepID=UPI00064512D6
KREIMSRHSKNKTSSGRFTYSERQELGYGTKVERLGKDSLKAFDSCCICLNSLISPLSCTKGHLYCKECIYTSLVMQKKQIKEKEKEWLQQLEKNKQLDETKRLKQVEDELKVFESNNVTYLDNTNGGASSSNSNGVKEMEPKLNSFWVVSPQSKESEKNKPDNHTMCPEGGHQIRMKQLIAVKFKQATGEDSVALSTSVQAKYCCPICDKILTNSHSLKLLKRCGHVFCESCIKRTMEGDNKKKDEKQVVGSCFVCAKEFESHEAISLQRGGTGFSGLGQTLEAKKYTPTAII